MQGANVFRFGSAGTLQETDYEQLIHYTFLYDEGDECTDVTGGFTAFNGAGTTSKGSNYLYAKTTTYQGNIPGFVSANKIDLSEYDRNHVIAKIISSTHGAWICFDETRSTTITYDNAKNYLAEMRVTYCSKDDPSGEKVYKYVDDTEVLDSGYAYIMTNYSSNSFDRSEVYVYNWFLTKPDNYTLWADKAELTATDLDTLVADEASMGVLMNSKEAIKYMVKQCTGTAMVAVLQSDVAKAALAASPYLNTVIGNEHWAKFIMMLAPELLNYTMLYDEGDECTEVTGGWNNQYTQYTSGGTLYTGSKLTKNISNISGNIEGKAFLSSTLVTDTIDLTGYVLAGVIAKVISSGIGANAFARFADTINSKTVTERFGIDPIPITGEKVLHCFDLAATKELYSYFQILSSGTTSEAISAEFSSLFVLKADNYFGCASKAGIVADTMTALIADSAKMQVLMLNEDAVDYLCGCTGDLMASIVASETAVAEIVGSAYATAKLTNHPVWRKFINMSPICEDAGLTAIL